MALVNFYRGLKEKYNQETHKDGLYFSTDSLEILLNGSSFGGGGLKDVTFSEGKLIFSFMNGNSLEVTIDEATQDLPGLLSAVDKQKLDNLPTGSEITEGLDKIGDNNYEGTNYITGQTNLTDAVVKLDSQLKSTDDTVQQLNQAAVKEVQVNGSKISAVSGVVNIPLASQSADGVLSKEDKAKLDKVLDTGEGTKYLTDNGTYVPLDKNSVGLGNVDNTADLDKPISTATQNALDGKVDKSEGKSLVADTLITKLEQLDDKATIDAAIADKIPLSQKGAASGVATLDENGKVPVEQLNGALAKVFGIEKAVANQAALPEDATEGQRYYTIDTKKIYERLTDSWDEGITPKEDTIYNFRKSDATGSEDRTNILYRWDGADLVEISSSLALGETSGTAYAGDKGKALADKIAEAYGASSVINGLSDITIDSDDTEGQFLSAPNAVVTWNGSKEQNDIKIPYATSQKAGVMSATDKTNLDSVKSKVDELIGDGGEGSIEQQITSAINEIKGDAAIYINLGLVEDQLEQNSNKLSQIDNYTVNGKKISENPVLEKTDIGLDKVDNTSDLEKPVSTATQQAIDTTKSTIDSYTINGYQISNNPILNAGDILLTGFVPLEEDEEQLTPETTDTVNQAIAKLLRSILNNAGTESGNINKLKESLGFTEDLTYSPTVSALNGKTVTEAIDYIAGMFEWHEA